VRDADEALKLAKTLTPSTRNRHCGLSCTNAAGTSSQNARFADVADPQPIQMQPVFAPVRPQRLRRLANRFVG
jgi:hypothetical protein